MKSRRRVNSAVRHLPVKDLAKQKRRTEFMLRWSPIFLAGACGAFLLSLKYAPFYPRYSVASAALGLTLGLVTVGCWRLDARSHLNIFVIVLAVMCWEGANWLLQEWLLGGSNIPGWLDFEGIAANLVALFAFLWLFRARIHRFVFGDVEQIVGRERREGVS